MAQHFSPRIVTEGMVLCLDAANRESYVGSGSSWVDLVSSSNNHTLVNTPTFSSSNGGYLTFNGTNQYATAVGPAVGTNSFTVEIWAYPTSSPANCVLFDTNSADNVGDGIMFSYVGGTFNFRYFGSFSPVISTSLSSGRWYHMVMSRIGTTVTGYINGTSVGTFTEAARNMSSTKYTLGTFTTRNNFFFPGYISIVRVYNTKGLTASEVSQNFSALRGRYGV